MRYLAFEYLHKKVCLYYIFDNCLGFTHRKSGRTQKINAIFFGPMLAVILLGMTTHFVSARAAKTGLVVGLLVFYMLVFVFGEEVQVVTMTLFGVNEELHFLHFLALVFVLTSILMLVMRKLRQLAAPISQSHLIL